MCIKMKRIELFVGVDLINGKKSVYKEIEWATICCEMTVFTMYFVLAGINAKGDINNKSF